MHRIPQSNLPTTAASPGPTRNLNAAAMLALRKILDANEIMKYALHWDEDEPDEATNAVVAELCAQHAIGQEAALDKLNKQSVTTHCERGLELLQRDSWTAGSIGKVLRDPGPYPNLKSAQLVAQNVVMPLGESDGEADSAVADEDAVDPASAEATRLRMRRMALQRGRRAEAHQSAESRRRVSKDAAARERAGGSLQRSAADADHESEGGNCCAGDGVLAAEGFGARAVATSQVLSLWWVVDNGVGHEGRYIRAVYMVTAQTIIGLLGAFVGCLLHVTGDRSPSIAVRALTIALPVALPFGLLTSRWAVTCNMRACTLLRPRQWSSFRPQWASDRPA